MKRSQAWYAGIFAFALLLLGGSAQAADSAQPAPPRTIREAQRPEAAAPRGTPTGKKASPAATPRKNLKKTYPATAIPARKPMNAEGGGKAVTGVAPPRGLRRLDPPCLVADVGQHPGRSIGKPGENEKSEEPAEIGIGRQAPSQITALDRTFVEALTTPFAAIGDTVPLRATLRHEDGRMVPNQRLAFFVAENPVGTGMTNGSGEARVSFRVPTNLGVGTKPFHASFAGNRKCADSLIMADRQDGRN